MKTLTIDGVTFEVVDETARSKGEGVFVVNYDTVTFAEIKAAQDAGKVCFLNFNGISLPLLGTNDTEAIFVREINENTDYMVTITVDGGKDFTIKDKNISDVYVAGLFSAKYADVKAAYEDGKACFVTYGALLCPMTVLDEEKAEFVGMLTPHIGIKGILYADGTYDFKNVRSYAVQTAAQTLSDDQKAQARTNIGALSAGDVDTVLQQAKDSGLFDGKDGQDGEDGYTPIKGTDYFDGYTPVKGKDYFDGANGKTAYAYAQDGGYTGTEAEFAAKLASDSDSVFVADYYSTKYAEIVAARDAGKVCFAVMGDMPLCSFVGITDTEATFSGVYTPDLGFQLTFGSNGKNDFGLINSNVKPVLYEAQALSDDQKAQARTNIGAVGYIAPANVAGTEQVTAKLYTSNGGSIAFGKEGPNSGTMIRLDQADGTCRLRFRASATAGAMVWEQPEQGAQLYVDLGKEGVDKHRIIFPSSAGTLALTSQIPSLSGYLPLSGGLMTGPLKFQAASLPGKSLQYICGIDAFASGGEMGWQSKADFLSGYLTTTGTAAKATADANGNNIASTYAKVTTANDYNGEQRFKNATYCPTITDTASGIGCAFKASRGLVNELLADKIIATASTGKIPFYSYTGASNGSMTGLTEFAYLSPGAFILRPPSGEGGQIQLEAAANDPTNTGICIDTAGGNFRIFGLQSADGTTTTGYGSVLAIHPYAKAITGGYSFDGIAAKATADGNGNNIASTYLPKSGGTLTGNLTVGSAKIQTNGYVVGTWLQTTANNATTSKVDQVCVQSNGWIYTRTLEQLRNDMNAASKDEVVTAANGSLKVTLSGTSVDKTLAQIETALNAGRHVYLVEGINVYQLSYHMAGMVAAFTSVLIPSADAQVSVRTVMVWDGMAPSVFTKTI